MPENFARRTGAGSASSAGSVADGAAPEAALVALFAVATGVLAANIYYAQPLVGVIAPALHLPRLAASLLVTLTQLGYALGLALVVPLGDMHENRGLVVRTVIVAIAAVAACAAAPDWPIFLGAALATGLACSAAQILVPMAAGLAAPAARGRVTGNVMAGLLLGILLARPAASLITYEIGWRMVFAASALLMAALVYLLATGLPEVRPRVHHSYGVLIASLFALFLTEGTLRRRAAYQAASFGAFSLYWTAVPLLLAEDFGFTQRGIAMFALVGAAGALSAPLAGRLADRGLGRVGTALSLALVIASFGISAWGASVHSVAVLATAGVLLDFGVQSNNIFGQRAIYLLAAEQRARLNGAYMAAFFVGGAIGSAVASLLLTKGGWPLVAAVGGAAPALALLYFAVNEIRRRRGAA